MSRESFLKRWSRRKQAAAGGLAADTGPIKSSLIASGEIEPEPIEADVPPQLPPVEALDFDSDFSGFMHSKVDPQTRNAALKKLFASPHYQVSDGLDVYVGDYSAPAELPAAMLAGLAHARTLLASGKAEGEEASRKLAQAAAPEQAAALPAEPDTAGAERPAIVPQAPDQPA